MTYTTVSVFCDRKYNDSYVGYFTLNSDTDHYAIYPSLPSKKNTITAYVKNNNFTFYRWEIITSQSGSSSTSYDTSKTISISVNDTQLAHIFGHVRAEFKGKTSTISFDYDGGSGGSSSATAEFDSQLPTILVPTKNNATFQGYYSEKNGEGTKYYNSDGTSDITSYDKASDATLYAYWKYDLIVHYDLNGGSGTIPDTVVQPGVSGTGATLPDDADYRPVGKRRVTTNPWNTQADGSGTYYTDAFTIDNTSGAGGEITLYAQWRNWASKTVTYKANGGTGNDQTQTIEPSDTAPYATAKINEDFSRTGYSFNNWNTAADGSGTPYIAGSSIIYNDNNAGGEMTLYAQWSPYKTTVTFYPNTGIGVQQSQDFYYGIAQNLKSNAQLGFYKTNWTFQGWSENSSATTPTYTDGQSVTFNPTSQPDTKSFYAIWSHDTCTVTFKSNGGTGDDQTQTFYKGDAQALTTISTLGFTRQNHTFAGWAVTEDGSVTYGDGVTLTITGNLTLFARWYTPLVVSYDLNGGVGSIEQTVVTPSETGKTLASVDSTHWPTNKAFRVWKYGGQEYPEGASITNNPTLSSQNITMVAQWKDNVNLTVVYHKMGGETESVEIPPGNPEGITVIQVSNPSGYTFQYYSLTEGGVEATAWSVGTLISNGGSGGTQHLYAVYSPNTYTVTFNRQEGTGGSSSATVTYGSVIPAITPPTKSGCNFGGYYTSTNGIGTKYVNASGIGVINWNFAENKTLYAYWSRIRYSIKISRPENINCRIKVSGEGASRDTTDSSVQFPGAEGAEYVIAIVFDSAFLARRYKPSTLGSINFEKTDDFSYSASLTVVSSQTLQVSITENPLFSITTDIVASERISNPSLPDVSYSPVADGEGKWFQQNVTASYSGLDSRLVFSSWSAIEDISGGQAYETQSAPTNDFTFGLDRNTKFRIIFNPKSVTTSCALDSASSAVGVNPSCEITDAYIVGMSHCGDTAKFTAAEVSGYEFADWVNANGSVVSTDRIYTCTLSGDISLKARYKVAVTVRVLPESTETGTVYLNGDGSGTAVTKYITLGSTCTFSCESSHFFAGWFSDSTHASPLQYNQQDTLVVTASVTMYAYLVRAEFYNYIAFYNYDQSEGQESYKDDLGSWTFNGGGSVSGVVAITKEAYQSATGLTALADGVFLEVKCVKGILVSITPLKTKGLSVVNEYAAANSLGQIIDSFSTNVFSFVANRNLIFRAQWGAAAVRTVSAGYCTGSENLGSATVDGSASKSITQGSSCSFVALALNGYKFAGWYSAAAEGVLVSTSNPYSFTVVSAVTLYAKFVMDRNAICEWEGSSVNKTMNWKSKTFVSSRPFSPVSMRIDALGYVPGSNLKVTVGMFSSPDSEPTEVIEMASVSSQEMRRLPRCRPEKYMNVKIENNSEVDAVIIGTSAMGVVA